MKNAFFTPSVSHPEAATAGAPPGRPVSSAAWLRSRAAAPSAPRRGENDLIRQTRAGLFRG